MACELTFKREVCEQRYVLVPLSAFGKSSKDKESPPAPALRAHAYTLHSNSKWIKVAGGDHTALDGSDCLHPSVHQENPRQNDTSSENPPRDVEGYGRFYLTRPAVENQQVDACEQINCVYGDADDEEEVEDAVG